MLLWIFAGQDETFHLVIGGVFLCLQLFIFTTIQEFIYCYKKLTSWWCFPREMSGIHKNRINLCFGSLFHLECRACLLKKLMTCHVVSFDQLQPNQSIGLSGRQPSPYPKCSLPVTFYSANTWLAGQLKGWLQLLQANKCRTMHP